MIFRFIAPLVLLSLSSASAFAQWNPSDNWQDSYAVDGQCYCNSSNYDHNLDEKTADTPLGEKNVVDICNDIEAALGEGPTDDRIHYNDIQCGNGPANDADDEAGCPGRVDMGSEGCNIIGPTWNLDIVYGTEVKLNRDDWVLLASRRNWTTYRANDGKSASRWNTRKQQKSGQWFEIDLASKKSFSRVELDTSRNPNDFPREFRVKVSNTGQYWREVAVGEGIDATTVASFQQQYARYIRIWLTVDHSANWWSIHEVNVYE